MTPSSQWLEVFSHAARRRVPLIVRARSARGALVLRDVLVCEVGLDFVLVRSRLDTLRSTVRFADVLSTERLDGRPFRPRARDARQELAERGDEHADRGGLE